MEGVSLLEFMTMCQLKVKNEPNSLRKNEFYQGKILDSNQAMADKRHSQPLLHVFLYIDTHWQFYLYVVKIEDIERSAFQAGRTVLALSSWV